MRPSACHSSWARRLATLVVFATHALYQLPREGLVRVLKSLQRHGEQRPLFFVSMEFTAARHSELLLTRYAGGAREMTKLADCYVRGFRSGHVRLWRGGRSLPEHRRGWPNGTNRLPGNQIGRAHV